MRFKHILDNYHDTSSPTPLIHTMATTTVAKTKAATDQRTQPNQSLYIQNLPEKLQKPDLKRSLYMLFSTFGPVLDVTAVKSSKMRGQAHVLFRDVHAATQAMRACQGFDFFGREMVRRAIDRKRKTWEPEH
jgi:U2 small nuclear ribonucleoprotein B''